ncbi:GNAT domain-containing protein [Xylariales sp. AK1849]|nr:GNAT domain-containing protein [Xylariales sp. AK1849]
MTSITVLTTLPGVEDNILQSFDTQRLMIRPLLHPTDLEAYRSIRSQPAAMTSSSTGLPDASMEQTELKLKHLQPPYCDSHVYFGIFLKNSDSTEGELIGDGGVHKFANTEAGWPEFGYKLKKEHWGLGYATEFVLAFMRYWWNELPRTPRLIRVIPCSVAFGDTPEVAEQVCAWTKESNRRSERVLEKVGFERFQGLANEMTNWRLTKELFEAKSSKEEVKSQRKRISDRGASSL